MKAFVIGFPKSGTLTLHEAFRASGLRSAHWRIPEGFCGELIYRADRAGRDPLWFLSAYDCITQADVCMPSRHLNFWPNLDLPLLGRLHRFHPECTFVLNYREPAKIAASMEQWADMHARLVKSDIPGLPRGAGATRGELETWIEDHFAACRKLFAGQPGFLELNIEDPAAAKRLSEALGVPIRWWGVSHSGPRPFEPGARAKRIDPARAQRIAARFARRLSYLTLAPIGCLRRTLRAFRGS